MDLTTILANAEKAGYTTVALHEKDFNLGNNYIIYFAKNGVIEGYVKTIPGEGWSWHYPQGLIDYVDRKTQEEEAQNIF